MISIKFRTTVGITTIQIDENGQSRFKLNVTKAFDTSGLSKFHLQFHIQLFHPRMHPDLIQMTLMMSSSIMTVHSHPQEPDSNVRMI